MEKREGFNFHEYPNGFRLAWKETPTDTIFGNLRIDHGALHEKSGEEGTAHFLEHMFIEGGTSKYSPEKQIEIRGMFGYSNAFTSRERTMIPFGMVPENFEDYLDIASEMAFYPRLDSKVLSQQKNIVKREIARKKGAPDFQDMMRFYFPSLSRTREHSYFVLGEEEVIENLTEEKLREFHKRGYGPNNMILELAGKLPDGIIDTVAKYFADKEIGEGEPFKYPNVGVLEERAIRYSKASDLINRENPEGSNAQIKFAVVVPDEFHAFGQDLNVTSEILGRGAHVGVRKRIRTDEGLSYEIGSFYLGDKRFGSLSIGGKVHAREKEKAIDIIFEELRRLKKDPQDESEVDRAKKRAAYKLTNGLERVFMNFVHADPVNVGTISKIDYEFDGRKPIGEKLSRLERVTPSSVQRAANDYLPSDRNEDNYVLLVRDPLQK